MALPTKLPIDAVIFDEGLQPVPGRENGFEWFRDVHRQILLIRIVAPGLISRDPEPMDLVFESSNRDAVLYALTTNSIKFSRVLFFTRTVMLGTNPAVDWARLCNFHITEIPTHGINLSIPYNVATDRVINHIYYLQYALTHD